MANIRKIRTKSAGIHWQARWRERGPDGHDRDCAKDDCIVVALGKLRKDLSCATGAAQTEALKFAVHFVGDIHQPLHTVAEEAGGNGINVDVYMRGLATCPNARPSTRRPTFTPPGTSI